MTMPEPGRAGADELSLALAAIVAEPRLTTALRDAERLREAAMRSPDPHRDAARLAALVRDGDDVASLAAVHALGAVADSLADEVLTALVIDAEEPYAAHAAWALAARRSSPAALDALVELVVGGGFTGMLAERTLVEWSRFDRAPAVAAIRAAGRGADQRADDRLSAVLDALPEARRALPHELAAGWADGAGDAGIVVIQPFLHAQLDRAGSRLGAGDAGGIASLLRSLGTRLAMIDGVDEVITVTRRHGTEPLTEQLAAGHRVQRIEVGPPGALPWREAWVHRAAIERQFVALGESLADRRVVWHLRMADVGTLAAAGAARRLGQPVVFTAAPDPHIVIDALQDDGRLDRSRFAVEDAAAQYWFRARMVERLTAQADHLTLLPRPTLERELTELVGIDPGDLAERSTVVPEGVDVGEVERARLRCAAGTVMPAVRRVLQSLPEHRRGLPWAITVGRLHPTKGPQRIVEAVTGQASLAAAVNVVIVGGDLSHPSPDEQSTIELIRRAASGAPAGCVSLTGHLSPAEVSDLVAWAAAHDGVYVCASDKEEFGLAIVEALAAGAVVVAPQRGGPRTYVDDGVTGVLCDTLSIAALRQAIALARSLVRVDDRQERVRSMVRDELSVERMAERLGAVYHSLLPAAVHA